MVVNSTRIFRGRNLEITRKHLWMAFLKNKKPDKLRKCHHRTQASPVCDSAACTVLGGVTTAVPCAVWRASFTTSCSATCVVDFRPLLRTGASFILLFPFACHILDSLHSDFIPCQVFNLCQPVIWNGEKSKLQIEDATWPFDVGKAVLSEYLSPALLQPRLPACPPAVTGWQEECGSACWLPGTFLSVWDWSTRRSLLNYLAEIL